MMDKNRGEWDAHFNDFMPTEDYQEAVRWFRRNNIPKFSKDWQCSVRTALFDVPGGAEVRSRLSRKEFQKGKHKILSIRKQLEELANEWNTSYDIMAAYIHNVFWFQKGRFARIIYPDLFKFFEFKKQRAEYTFQTFLSNPVNRILLDNYDINYRFRDNVILFNLNDVNEYLNMNIRVPIHSITVSFSPRYSKYLYKDFGSLSQIKTHIIESSDVIRYLLRVKATKLSSATGYVAKLLKTNIYDKAPEGIFFRPVNFRHRGYYKVFYEKITDPLRKRSVTMSKHQFWVSFNALSFIVRHNIQRLSDSGAFYAKVAWRRWHDLERAILSHPELKWYMQRGYNRPLRKEEQELVNMINDDNEELLQAFGG